MKYRLYIDEVGNPDMGASEDLNHRYLSLTGVILELGYVQHPLHHRMEELKREFFGSHPDEPVVFHRKELVNRGHPFEALRDPALEQRFNEELLRFLRESQYTVLTAMIDKLEHRERYQVWRYDPYHYCLHVLMGRYVMWLRRRGARGDAMAESRGGKEDRRLKDSYARICNDGTEYMEPHQFRGTLTSLQLKVKSKANNVTGLQIADLVAHPSFKLILARQAGQDPPANFGGQIGRILLESKYDRDRSGRIDGWGIKWLP